MMLWPSWRHWMILILGNQQWFMAMQPDGKSSSTDLWVPGQSHGEWAMGKGRTSSNFWQGPLEGYRCILFRMMGPPNLSEETHEGNKPYTKHLSKSVLIPIPRKIFKTYVLPAYFIILHLFILVSNLCGRPIIVHQISWISHIPMIFQIYPIIILL